MKNDSSFCHKLCMHHALTPSSALVGSTLNNTTSIYLLYYGMHVEVEASSLSLSPLCLDASKRLEVRFIIPNAVTARFPLFEDADFLARLIGRIFPANQRAGPSERPAES